MKKIIATVSVFMTVVGSFAFGNVKTDLESQPVVVASAGSFEKTPTLASTEKTNPVSIKTKTLKTKTFKTKT